MPRIAGVNIPDNKQILIALTYVYGIGLSLSKKILMETNIDPYLRAEKLSPEQINNIRDAIAKNYKIEGDLRREIMTSVKRLKDIGCWRGHRHMKSLPTRGQRTKRNSRTARGNVRRTVGSGRKSAPAAK